MDSALARLVESQKPRKIGMESRTSWALNFAKSLWFPGDFLSAQVLQPTLQFDVMDLN